MQSNAGHSPPPSLLPLREPPRRLVTAYHAVRAFRTGPRGHESLLLRVHYDLLRASFPPAAPELPGLAGDVLAAFFPTFHVGDIYAPDGRPYNPLGRECSPSIIQGMRDIRKF